MSDTTNKTRKITNKICATQAAVPAIPVKPNKPAMIAMIKNVIA